MNYKKIFSFSIIFIFLIVPVTSFADDCDEEKTFFDFDIEVSNNLNQIPSINSRHAIVLDRSSKLVLFGKNENEQCKMASTTKIMTAIVVIENCPNLNDIVTVSKKAARTQGSRLGLSTNDTITVNNLLYGLLMVSGNDAAVALAEYICGSVSSFADLMNEKASQLNLTNSHFVSPHGLDHDEHYTTAYELALISDYALKNETFSKIVKTSNYTVNISGYPKQLHNTNELLGYLDGVYGVKTGFTNGANRCLVSSCKRGSLDIICVVLGCDTKKDRTSDSIKLINYVFNNFSVLDIKNIVIDNFEVWKKEAYNSFFIEKGVNSSLELYLDTSKFPYDKVVVSNSTDNPITTSFSVIYNYKAPLFANNVIGNMSVFCNGNYLFSIDIFNKNTIKRKDISYYWKYFLKDYFTFFTNNV